MRERLYSVATIDAVSDDLLVNNVGVSAAYQSPPHFDVTDVGWTFAFACKCGCCQSERTLAEHNSTQLNSTQLSRALLSGVIALCSCN